MDVGVMVRIDGQAPDRSAVRDVGQAAEELGFSSVWVNDHIARVAAEDSSYPYNRTGKASGPGRPFYELIPVLGFLAAATERVSLGTGVCVLPYRHPVQLSKALTTIDQLSQGRLIFGAGVGWLAEEFAALDVDFSARGPSTDEALAFLDAAWHSPPPTSFKQDRLDVDGLYLVPGPYASRRIPIWVGGNTQGARSRAVRHADTWFPHIHGLPPTVMSERFNAMSAARAESGRGGELGLSLFANFELTPADNGDSPPPTELGAISGTPDFLVEVLSEYAAIGVEHVVLVSGATLPRQLEELEELHRYVLPALAL